MEAPLFAPSLAPGPGGIKSWVLAMLAAKRRLRVAPVPPRCGEFDTTRARRPGMGRSGRRNRHFNRTKEHRLASQTGLARQTSDPIWSVAQRGDTINAPHTEIRILPGRYLNFYNTKRPHSSLDARTPDHAYFNHPPLRLAA